MGRWGVRCPHPRRPPPPIRRTCSPFPVLLPPHPTPTPPPRSKNARSRGVVGAGDNFAVGLSGASAGMEVRVKSLETELSEIKSMLKTALAARPAA